MFWVVTICAAQLSTACETASNSSMEILEVFFPWLRSDVTVPGVFVGDLG